MNPTAVLALIGDLYAQNAALVEENRHLKEAAAQSSNTSASAGPSDRE